MTIIINYVKLRIIQVPPEIYQSKLTPDGVRPQDKRKSFPVTSAVLSTLAALSALAVLSPPKCNGGGDTQEKCGEKETNNSGMLDLLNTTPSLHEIARILDNTLVVNSTSECQQSGREFLHWILENQQYNPFASNEEKERIFQVFHAVHFVDRDPVYPAKVGPDFFITLATSLYVEYHQLVLWSLASYSAEEVAQILPYSPGFI